MQTAAEIAIELSVNEIEVNYNLSEYMRCDFFPEGNPLPHLIISNSDPQHFSSKYLKNVAFKFVEGTQPTDVKFPEVFDD